MQKRKLIIVAIGGNGICPSEPGAEMSFTAQLIHTKRTLWNLIPLFNHFQVVLTHGNGPQAGLVYDQMIPTTPFGVVTLITTSQISSAITRAYEELILENNLRDLPPMEPVLCWVAVDPDDPGLEEPSKPVGPQLSEAEVAELSRHHPDYRFSTYGKGQRRLIGSPQPQQILNLEDIHEVIEDGKVPVALGGGGIPWGRAFCFWDFRSPSISLEKDLPVVDWAGVLLDPLFRARASYQWGLLAESSSL